MLFLNAVNEFLRYCKIDRQLSQHTIQAYECDLSDLHNSLPRNILISDISIDDLKRYLQQMVEQRRLSPATVRRRLACLRAFYRYIATLEKTANPFLEWRPIVPRRKRLPRTLSRIEASSLLSSPSTHDEICRKIPTATFFIAIRVMISTGIRVGEMCSIQLDDVSADGSAIRIRGKGSRDRIVYIADSNLRFSLQQYVANRHRSGTVCCALFLNRLGSGLRPQSIRSRLRKYAGDVGITRRVTPHMLRHTAATL